MRIVLAAAVGLSFGGASAAQAEWREASSAHFVVYADASEHNISLFSEQLETYDRAMEQMTGLELPEPSPSNRVTVYVVDNEREVRELYGEGSRYIDGFYVPRAGGSFAIVPQVRARKGETNYSMLTLLHEYAHHFLISNTTQAAPRWVGEGAAEFFASAEFPISGGIKIGMPAYHRAGELFYAKNVPVEMLLDPKAYENGAHDGFDSFYGKSWLLYHYLSMGNGRDGQLQQYLELMAHGKSSLEAGREAFGDLDALDDELDRYVGARMSAVIFKRGTLPIGQVAVRQLSDGEAAILPLKIRSKRGVSRDQASELLGEVREVAAAYPRDPAVLAELAEAEYDAGHDAEAIAAADAALALDPKRVNAYVQKGYALFREASKADDPDKAYGAAVAPFVKLNAIENDHPLPLIYYFRSFADRGAEPPELAVRGLERAAELAPFDLGLRMNLAEVELAEGQYDAARRNLAPVAYNPHGGSLANGARALIERIDSGSPPDGKEALTILAAVNQQPSGPGSED